MPTKKYFGKELGFILFRENKLSLRSGFHFSRSKSSRKRQLGFTLIELLVVIAIISILAVFLFVSFTQVQKNSRDAQRKSDLQTVASALQRFYSDNSHYPNGRNVSGVDGYIKFNSTNCLYDTTSPPVVGVIWGATVPESISLVNKFECNGHTYLKQLPTDPLNKMPFTSPYAYCYSTNGGNLPQNFQLYAKMENQNNANIGNTTCGPFAINYYNYIVTSND